MKPCRDCQRQISEQALACPNCGAPFPAREPLSSPRQARFLLTVGLLFATGAGYFTHVTLEAFGEMLLAAGHLPAAATPLLRFSPLLLALGPLVVLGVWRFWPKPTDRGIAAACTGGALFFFLPNLASTIMSSLALR